MSGMQGVAQSGAVSRDDGLKRGEDCRAKLGHRHRRSGRSQVAEGGVGCPLDGRARDLG